MHKDYFEGILQLRNVDSDILEFSVNAIEKRGNVAKIKQLKNGFDIYMAPQRFLRSLTNNLQARFGGQVIISKKLHTKNRITSREVYRVNALFRIPIFKKGETINFRGEKIKIVSMHKKVLAKDLVTGKKLTLSYKDLINH